MKKGGSSPRPEGITDRFVRSVCERLSQDKPVRRRLPVWGRLHIDRQLPFLCVYRRPPAGGDTGTGRLVTSEASYLIASGAGRDGKGLRRLIRAVVETLAAQFGAFLLVEVWSEPVPGEDIVPEPGPSGPRFRIVAPGDESAAGLLTSFQSHLGKIKVGRIAAEVRTTRAARWGPRRLAALLPPAEAKRLNCTVVGLEVAPIWRDPDPQAGTQYPLVLRGLRRGLTRALRRTFFEFSRSRTTHLPRHYHMLGRRAMVKAVWEVDRRMAEVSDGFDFLLQVTPVNAEQAWNAFRRSRYSRTPVFRYRPIPVDPVLLKRRLYDIPVERIEDPTLSHLFREKQDELDRQITMLADRNTSRFLHGSIQLYGDVSKTLAAQANDLLEAVSPRAREEGGGGSLEAEAFAAMAREEIAHYREQLPGIDSRVEVRGDIVSGLMVSRGSLLVGRKTRIPASRAPALLQHEVGTHVLTWHNGRAQPFRQLYSGLAGYEALQEGIAVLAEFLVGGLSRTRLRLLGARVAAVQSLVRGASFAETFQMLHDGHGYSTPSAFTIAMRVYRGGGLTKDAVYLRGLMQVLEYLSDGGRLDRLFVGKIATRHVPIVRELQLRGILKDAPLRPRYLDMPEAVSRLERVRQGLTVQDLVRPVRRGRRRPTSAGGG